MAEAQVERSIDMRYRRQTHDLMVVFPAGPVTPASVRAGVERFQSDYEANYGRGSGFREAGIELSTFRVQATGRPRKPELSWSGAATVPQPAKRPLFEPLLERWMTVEVWQWLELPIGHRIPGTRRDRASRDHGLCRRGPDRGPRFPRQSLHRSHGGERMTPTSMTPIAITAGTATTIDPITFEVIRHKLQAITEEQAITLKRVSGSPVVTEATDFNNGLYLADGSIVTMGPQVIFHTGTMSTVIRNIIKDFAPRDDIHEGDMFILNDPYRGAIHQPDVSIVAPIFHEGRHIAWAGTCAHQLDVGGMSFGSWAYAATDVQQEAMLLTGLKLVEGGKLREDLWQMIMSMTRLPNYLGLDFKGMIAANNVAILRMGELFQRYGVGTVEAVMGAEIDASERRMRERLRQIPDGIYRARDYIDHDGHTNKLYEVCLAVHKTGDEIVFDLEGTSLQAPGFINCTWSGMKGALFTGLLPILAPDIRWNEGVLRTVTIRAPEGILCNAKWPAPVSGATVCAVWIVMNVAVAALSRMVSCAPAMIREAQAVTKGQMSVLTLAGKNRDGESYGTLLLDSMAGGGGASVDLDGLDGSGDYDVPRPAIANVEANESSGPLLYLFRSFVPDTAGPGRTRGRCHHRPRFAAL